MQPTSGSNVFVAGDIDGAANVQTARLTKANPLSRKLNKILDISLEDADTQQALQALSEVYSGNSLQHASSLRSEIEKRVAATNKQFLKNLDVVAHKVRALEEELKSVNDCCWDMEAKLRSATDDTSHLMRMAKELKDQSQQCLARRTIIDAFLSRFTLTDMQLHVLSSPDESVGVAFFEALRRLQRLTDDCRALLVTDRQEAGIEIMESLASYQETAYDKLFRWTQLECRSLGQEAPEIAPTLREALRALKERPVLFQACIEEVTSIRYAAIARSYLDALTRGGPGGLPRPIELHAADPLRYIGDMLAWLHQAVTEEHELLDTLFSARLRGSYPLCQRICDSDLRPVQDRHMSSKERGSDSLDVVYDLDDDAFLSVLDKNLAGTCRPLKSRVEQVLMSQTDAILAYRLCNIVHFYENIIVKAMGANAALSVTVHELTELAYKMFFDALNAHASLMFREVQLPSDDLQPPPILRETVLQLREIMAIYDESLVTFDRREEQFAGILSALWDPLSQMCVLGASRLPPIENAVYLVNCMQYVQNALSLYPFTATQAQAMESQIEAQLELLVNDEYKNMLRESGLEGLRKAGPVTAQALRDAMDRLDVFLYSAVLDTTSDLGKLSKRKLASQVTRKSFKLFMAAYKALFEEVENMRRDQVDLPAMRAAEEVETLLSLEQDDL
ncbi:Golgi transport complex subunit 6 [Gaertneriomyces sp. JEL0708]|nr:Golgi transport complex subunit 6 [Gaertneriomyces sp. JEL0708]